MFTEFGVVGRTMDEYEEDVKRSCSGFSISHIVKSPHDFRWLVSFHSLDEKRADALRLLHETLMRPDYGNISRLKTQLLSMAASSASSIGTSGQHYALAAAASKFGGKFAVADVTSGLRQAQILEEMSGNLRDPVYLESIVKKIKEIHNFLLCGRGDWRLAVIARDDCTTGLTNFLKAFPSDAPATPQTGSVVTTSYGPILRFPISTSFSAACTLVDAQSPVDKASLLLAAEILKAKYLHREIREKGGAYGAGASFNHLDGLFSFYSYRDPSPAATVDIFKRSIDWLKARQISERDVEEAKLSLIGSLDSPQDLGDEGLTHFKHDIGDNERTDLRRAILRATSGDICSIQVDPNSLSTCIISGV
jgi:Zn-dependent M16 (insulinase) family peptidase